MANLFGALGTGIQSFVQGAMDGTKLYMMYRQMMTEENKETKGMALTEAQTRLTDAQAKKTDYEVENLKAQSEAQQLKNEANLIVYNSINKLASGEMLTEEEKNKASFVGGYADAGLRDAFTKALTDSSFAAKMKAALDGDAIAQSEVVAKNPSYADLFTPKVSVHQVDQNNKVTLVATITEGKSVRNEVIKEFSKGLTPEQMREAKSSLREEYLKLANSKLEELKALAKNTNSPILYNLDVNNMDNMVISEIMKNPELSRIYKEYQQYFNVAASLVNSEYSAGRVGSTGVTTANKWVKKFGNK